MGKKRAIKKPVPEHGLGDASPSARGKRRMVNRRGLQYHRVFVNAGNTRHAGPLITSTFTPTAHPIFTYIDILTRTVVAGAPANTSFVAMKIGALVAITFLSFHRMTSCKGTILRHAKCKSRRSPVRFSQHTSVYDISFFDVIVMAKRGSGRVNHDLQVERMRLALQ